jgi:hypothetical protein
MRDTLGQSAGLTCSAQPAAKPIDDARYRK